MPLHHPGGFSQAHNEEEIKIYPRLRQLLELDFFISNKAYRRQEKQRFKFFVECHRINLVLPAYSMTEDRNEHKAPAQNATQIGTTAQA